MCGDTACSRCQEKCFHTMPKLMDEALMIAAYGKEHGIQKFSEMYVPKEFQEEWKRTHPIAE